MTKLILEDESYKIIGTFYEVYNNLGMGFLESVYQAALTSEFEEQHIPFKEQWGIEVFYKNKKLDKKFFADYICYGDIIIEIKAVERIAPQHEAQLINYLKATNKPLGFLVNFGGKKLDFRRFVNTR